ACARRPRSPVRYNELRHLPEVEYDFCALVRDPAALALQCVEGIAAEQRHAIVRPCMPSPLQSPCQEMEADPAPEVRDLTVPPSRFDAEPDLAGLVVLLDQEPLPTRFQVPLQRVVSE